MPQAKKNLSFPLFLKSRLFIGLFTIAIVLSGCLFYTKYAVKKWCEEQKLEISVKGTGFHWQHLGFPGISFREVTIKNKNPGASCQTIQAKAVSVQPDLFSLFKHYLKGYKLSLTVENLKIRLASGDVLESDKTGSNIEYESDVYKITDFKVEPVRLILTPNSTTLKEDDTPNPDGSHLIIYQVKGKGEYVSTQDQLNLFLEVPPASSQMPEGKTYAVKAKGGMKFLDTSSHKDPGIRGKITFTIDNLSNLLQHLYQARIISSLVKNLGTLVGHPVSRKDLFTRQKEIFTDAVSLDLTFQPDGIYIGPVKL